jgi:hypothetical protein
MGEPSTMKKYSLVEAFFLDHYTVRGRVERPVTLRVVGYLYKEDKYYYYLATCIAEDDFYNYDTETFAVLKSALAKPLRKISSRTF